MLFRKTRTHLQGASNRPQTHLGDTHHTYSSVKPLIVINPSPSISNMKSPFTSFASKRKHTKKRLSFTQGEETITKEVEINEKPLRTVEDNLRKKYKNSKNIVKLLDHWGFKTNGFITRQKFKERIEKSTGQEPSQQQLNSLMLKHSKSSDYMNTQGIISLLLSKTDGIPIDTVNMPISQNSPSREQLVCNLKESLKNYQKSQQSELTEDSINTFIAKFNKGVSRMKKLNQGKIEKDRSQFFFEIKKLNNFSSFQEKMLNQIQRGVNFEQLHQLLQFHKNADYLLADPILRKTQCMDEQRQARLQQNISKQMNQTFQCKMRSLPNLFNRTLRDSEKRVPFDPISLINVDQRKTRFDRSQFTKESNGWNPKLTSVTVEANQKQKLMETLRDQASIKKMRYQNKLSQIRANKQKCQQNVEIVEQLAQQREKNRLQALRNQQQAYNYINFIKKRWQ